MAKDDDKKSVDDKAAKEAPKEAAENKAPVAEKGNSKEAAGKDKKDAGEVKEGEAAEKVPLSKKKRIVIASAALILVLVIIVVVMLFLTGGKEESVKPAGGDVKQPVKKVLFEEVSYLAYPSDILAVLTDKAGKKHHLRVNIVLVIDKNKKIEDLLTGNMPLLTSESLEVIEGKTHEELSTQQGKQALRIAILEKIKSALPEQGRQIKEVLFSTLMMD